MAVVKGRKKIFGNFCLSALNEKKTPLYMLPRNFLFNSIKLVVTLNYITLMYKTNFLAC